MAPFRFVLLWLLWQEVEKSTALVYTGHFAQCQSLALSKNTFPLLFVLKIKSYSI